ncbi:MAG: alpha/beta hydrolase [Hyphomicrobium sp.]|nr:alpha/beta hydrolase [Hyphomicrobium sp.]
MLDTTEPMTAALLLAGVVILFAFAWVATGAMPKGPRLLARLCLTILAIVPLALGLWTTFESDRTASEPPPISSSPPPPPAPKPVPPTAEAPPPVPDATPTDREKEEKPGDGAAAPSLPQAPGSTSPDKNASAPPMDSGPPAGGAAPPPPDETKYAVVPVYFGTDRAEAPIAKRVDFSAQRGRRLALGEALVTVPKNHEVPQVERPWTLSVPLIGVVYQEAEDPAEHFTMKELKTLTREELIARVRERLAKSERFKDHAIVFVHGFNTTFDNAVYRTAQIAYDLKFDGAPFLYSWPSGGGVASYTYDRESAGQAEPYLRDFLDLVVKESGAKTVSVIAHSMGNQPTLQVLKDIRASQPTGVVISEIILAAPDVDRDNFENIARDIQGLAKGVTLYAARNDYALDVSRRFHGGIPRAGDAPDGQPLVLPGIDTIDVTAVSTDSLGINHSGYAENNTLLNDIQLLIQTGERPPEKRVPVLEKVDTEKGPFWRYPGQR